MQEKTEDSRTQNAGFHSFNQKALISSGTYWVPGERSLENKTLWVLKFEKHGFKHKRQGDGIAHAYYLPGTMLGLLLKCRYCLFNFHRKFKTELLLSNFAERKYASITLIKSGRITLLIGKVRHLINKPAFIPGFITLLLPFLNII